MSSEAPEMDPRGPGMQESARPYVLGDPPGRMGQGQEPLFADLQILPLRYQSQPEKTDNSS